MDVMFQLECEFMTLKQKKMLNLAINFEFLVVFGWECDSQIPQIKPLGKAISNICIAHIIVYVCSTASPLVQQLDSLYYISIHWE